LTWQFDLSGSAWLRAPHSTADPPPLLAALSVTLSNPLAPIPSRTPSHSLRDPKRVESLYAPLCEHLADGVLVLDPDGVIVYANRAAANLLHADVPSLLGRRPLAEANGSEFADAVRDVLARGGERVLATSDGDGVAFGKSECRVAGVPGVGALLIVGGTPLPEVPDIDTGLTSAAVQQFEWAQQTARHASTLAAAARILTRTVSPQSLYTNIARIASEALGAEGLTIFLADAATKDVEVAFTRASSYNDPTVVIPHFWESVAGKVVASGTPYFCADTRAALEDTRNDRFLAEIASLSIPSFALLPLVVEGRPRGLLSIRFRERRPFGEEDRYLISDFSLQVAIALHNSLLFAAERREREQAEAAAAIARLALGATNIEGAATQILEIIDGVVPTTGLSLGVMAEGATVRYVAARGSLEGTRGVSIPIEHSAARLALGGSEPVFVADFREVVHPESAHLTDPATAGAIIPLVAKERVLGVIHAMTPLGTQFPAAQVAALARLAATVALAFDVLLMSAEERHQRERERMLATALATMDQPVFVAAADGRIRYANSAAGREYGFSPTDLTAMTLDGVLAPSARPLDPRLHPSAMAEQDVWTGETTHRRKDGSELPVFVTLSPIRGESGLRVGQVMTVRNLAEERRQAEHQRQAAKMVALGELVAGVAHEVNNPLAAISAFSQLLLEETLGEEQYESVRLIKREADRAVAVIRDLLTFARKTPARDTVLDVNELVAQTLRLRAYGFKAVGIEVITELDPAVPLVRADHQKIQQVLLNLIVNAEHAMQSVPERRLRLVTRCEGDGVSIAITDTGSGMSPEVQARIFEPFFTTKPEGTGTGLGLSVSYGIVQAHGGSLTCESTPGLGTTFRIALPVVHAPTSFSPSTPFIPATA
jgi:PAS domain S-box-containing protein